MSSNRCPSCKDASVTVDSLFPNKNLREAVNAYKRSMGIEVKEASSADVSADQPLSPPPSELDAASITSNGMLTLAHLIDHAHAINPWLRNGSAITAAVGAATAQWLGSPRLPYGCPVAGAPSHPDSKPATPSSTTVTPPQSPPSSAAAPTESAGADSAGQQAPTTAPSGGVAPGTEQVLLPNTEGRSLAPDDTIPAHQPRMSSDGDKRVPSCRFLFLQTPSR